MGEKESKEGRRAGGPEQTKSNAEEGKSNAEEGRLRARKKSQPPLAPGRVPTVFVSSAPPPSAHPLEQRAGFEVCGVAWRVEVRVRVVSC